jgi:hypothetical protein
MRNRAKNKAKATLSGHKCKALNISNSEEGNFGAGK